MMSRFLFVTLLFSLFACGGEEVTPVVDPTYVFELNGQMYEADGIVTGGNENCGTLYITTDYYLDGAEVDAYNVDFEISKEGHLLRADVVHPPSGGLGTHLRYLTQSFNPISTFGISDFSLDELTGHVEFKYKGTLFYERDNNRTLDILGYVNTELNMDVPCCCGNPGLDYESDEINLFSLTHNRDKWSTGRQTHFFFSNNGFRIDHSLATESIPGAGEYWSGKLAWEVEFKLSQYGHPISVRYLEKNPNYGHGLVFLPPNFNPMSTFRISDFHYDSTTGEISFSYEGTVFYDQRQYCDEGNPRQRIY
jgi:hypothetical protein